MTLNFNNAPYWNDYDQEKGFLKILFKPGYAVQARELTQSQDILQNQIGSFGSYIFKSGSPVLGGQITLDTNVTFANLNPLYSNTSVNINQFLGTVVTDSATQTVRASVIAVVPQLTPNPPTLMMKYLTGVTFANGANITVYGSSSGPFALLANTSATGIGSCCSLNEGVFFLDLSNLNPTPNSNANIVSTTTNAYFVRVPKQTIILDAYDNTPTYMVGLQISDAIVSTLTDSTLLDPALGSTSYQGPGADRYIINATLSTRQLTSQDTSSFVQLLTVNNGQLQSITNSAELSGIMNTLAKRTNDQSGSFTVKPFRLSLLDSANSDTANANTQLYYAMVGPGNAYVEGFNYQSIAKQFLTAPRARTIANVSAYSIQSYFGNYFLVDTVNGEFNFSTLPLVDIHCVNWANVVVTSAASYANTLIGTASLRSFEYNSSSNTSNALTYVFRAGLFNINTNPIILYANGNAPTSTSIAFYNGASPTNNAYMGMTLNVPLTGDNRLITSYVGSTRTATISAPFSTLPLNNSQINILGNIQSAESIGLNTMSSFITANSNINIGSKNQANAYQYAFLSDTNFSPIIFNFPNQFIAQGLQSPSYQYRAKIASGQTLQSGTPLVVNLTIPGDSSAQFVSGTESGSDLLTLSDFLAVTNPGGGVAGQIVPMVSALTRTVSSTPTTATFTMKSGDPTFNNVDIFASIKTTIGAKTKTLITANTIAVSSSGGTTVGTTTVYPTTGQILFGTPNATNLVSPGIAQDLYISDGIGIVAIIDSGFLGTSVSNAMLVAAVNGTTMPAGSSNITNNYTFFNGQKDAIYDHATITLNPGAPLPSGQVLVLLNYYSPSTTGGYFSVDSYPAYATIPVYKSPNQSLIYSLRDCIDWRPVRDSATSNYTFNNAGTIFLPEPIASSGFTVGYGYYLGRVDQLVLTKNGNFIIVQGSSSLNPYPATKPKGSMLLYSMVLPPYTITANSIVITQQNNQRYTMADIGNLEKRIQTLEYYNSLSQVEQQATNQNITDSNGVVVPQLGLLVDAFTGSSVASVSDRDYAASIDGQNQQLRPPFTLQSAMMVFDPSSSSNYQLNGVTITLPYTLTTFISQNVASRIENLNPFNITVWNGNLTLNPPSDVWISTQSLPSVTTNLSGDNDAFKSGKPTPIVLGTVWNSWQTIYTGIATNSSTTTIPPNSTGGSIIYNNNPWAVMEAAAGNPQAYSSTVTNTTTTTTQDQTRTGIQTVLSVDQLTVPVGTNIVSTSVIPHMRNIGVNFIARGMKPLAQVYPFLDNINIINYTKSYGIIKFTSNNTFLINSTAGQEILTDTDGGTNGGAGANSCSIILYKGNIAYVSNVNGVIYPGKIFQSSITGNTATVQSYNHTSGITTNPAGELYKKLPFQVGVTSTINANSICLQGGASNTDGYYVGNTIYINVNGNSLGISSNITAYNGASRIATVTPTWSPDSSLTGTNAKINYSIGIMQTDQYGDIAGQFLIPDNSGLSFQTGTGTFALMDNNAGNLNLVTTKATTQFVSQGTLDVTQAEYVTTQVPVITTQSVSQSQVISSAQSQQTVVNNQVGYYDPLAQTFLIDVNVYPNGVFITSLRVCFYTIDSVLPVTLQIRPTENGYPSSSTIIPGSVITLIPSQCKITTAPSLDDPNQYTEFVFNDPIFLLPGHEFSVVLISNSNNYNIYTAAVGDIQLGSNQIISKPPYMGVLFKSQNSSTWTPTQGETLMFRLNKAIFSNAPGFVTFKNVGYNSNSESVPLQPSSEFYLDTMYVTNNDQTTNNTSISYGFRGTANTGRAFDSAYSSFVPNRNYNFNNRYVVTPNYGSFAVQSQMQTPSSDISPIIDITRYSIIGIGNIVNNGSIGNNQITVTIPGTSYNIANTNSVTINGGGGSAATLQLGSLDANGNVISIIVPTNGGGSTYSGSANITISSSGYIPVQANAVFNGETGSAGGNFLARYITRSVTLSPGVVAGNLQVWLDAYLPQGTNIFVYYKILSPQDPTPLGNRPWTQMSIVGTQTVSTIQNSFTTYEYVGGLNPYGNPINSISYGAYNAFNQFTVKIVMATNNQAIVPLIKNLRIYALPSSA